MKNKKNMEFCNNCGKLGHTFYKCNHPITSLGIIAFRYNSKINQNEFLMIRRKDTLGYVDFMRGKYNINNKSYILNIINEMTLNEKNNLQDCEFDLLWNELWGNNVGIQYKSEEKLSKEKFNLLKEGLEINNKFYSLKTIISESNTYWKEPEWGFPKGRRNFQEKDIVCALREFEEETGFSKLSLKIINNLLPFNEVFTGSNLKSYKHKYYVANIDYDILPDSSYQQCEVSKVEWLSYEKSLKKIRPYNLEKIDILNRVNELLNKYTLYS